MSDYTPYVPKDYTIKTEKYDVVKVKPLSTVNEKRLSVFVVLHKIATDKLLTTVTKEIVEQLKYTDVYSSKQGEDRFSNTPAKAI